MLFFTGCFTPVPSCYTCSTPKPTGDSDTFVLIRSRYWITSRVSVTHDSDRHATIVLSRHQSARHAVPGKRKDARIYGAQAQLARCPRLPVL
jgi:hypothetical protein